MAGQPARLVTIGYEGRTVEELVEDLAERDVDLLVDVRLTPLSHKPGMSKRRLGESVEAAGITYLHQPELGNPRENRDPLHRGEAAGVSRYRAVLRTRAAVDVLHHLVDLSRRERVALLCVERDPAICHRRLVVEAMHREDPTLTVEDIV